MCLQLVVTLSMCLQFVLIRTTHDVRPPSQNKPAFHNPTRRPPLTPPRMRTNFSLTPCCYLILGTHAHLTPQAPKKNIDRVADADEALQEVEPRCRINMYVSFCVKCRWICFVGERIPFSVKGTPTVSDFVLCDISTLYIIYVRVDCLYRWWPIPRWWNLFSACLRRGPPEGWTRDRR